MNRSCIIFHDMNASKEHIYVRKKRVVFQEIDGVVHILDEKHDTIITLNNTATVIWNRLSKPTQINSIASFIASSHMVTLSQAIKDVNEFTKKMHGLGFLMMIS